MDLRQLRHFTVLAETLNFTTAAARLGIAQPALSVSIRKLEARIGATLFHRHTREVRLTEEGRLALAPARLALQSAEEIRLTARSIAAGEKGRLSIGFVNSATYRLLQRGLPAFRSRAPGIELDLHEGNTQQILGLIDSGRLDLGIIRYPLMEKRRYQPIPSERDRLVAVLPPDHPLAAKPKLSLADLAAEPMILYSSRHVPALNRLVLLAYERAGLMPRVVQEATHFHTIISLVESRIGFGIVPSVCRLLYGGKLAFRPIADAGDGFDVGLGIVTGSTAAQPATGVLVKGLLAETAD